MNPLGCIIVVFFVPILLLIGGFIFIIIKIISKTKTNAWKGEVVDKLYKTQSDDNDVDRPYYTLVVKTDEGLTRKIAVSRAMYDSCEIGDKMEKPKGALNPKKA